jgi:hypothetical protein
VDLSLPLIATHHSYHLFSLLSNSAPLRHVGKNVLCFETIDKRVLVYSIIVLTTS